MVSLFGCIFVFNLILTFLLKYPIINDEFCILSDAASLSGKYDWSTAYNSSVNGYWGYGFSILLIPFFWIFDSITIIYHIGLVLNSILVGLMGIIVYKISNDYIKQKNPMISWFCGLVIALFPGISFYSKMMLNEIMLVFIAWVSLFLVLKIQQEKIRIQKVYVFSFFLGFLAVYAYAVHGRGVAITAAIVLIMFYLRIVQKKGRLSALFLGGLACFGVDRIIKSILYSKLIFTDPSQTFNTAEKVLSSHLEYLKPENLKGLLTAIVAQSYYLLCVTGGIFCLFIAIVVIVIISHKKSWIKENNAFFTTTFFSACCVFFTLGISALYYAFVFVQHDTIRREYIIYGRYVDTIVVLGIFCVIQFFFMKFPQQKKIIIGSIIPFIIILGIGSTKIANWLITYAHRELSYVMVEGIIPIGGNDFWNSVNYAACWKLAAVVVCLFTVFIILIKKRSKYLFLVILIASVYSTWYSFDNYLIDSSEKSYDSTEEAAQFLRSVDIDNSIIYLLDYSGRTLNLQTKFPSNEFYMLDTEISGYSSYKEIKENSIIISSENKFLNYYLPDCKAIEVFSDSIYIWAYGTEIQQILEAENIKFNENEKILNVNLEDFSTSSGDNVFDNKIYLVPGETLYGPYIEIPAGEYHLSLTGVGLDETSISVTDNLGTTQVAVNNLAKDNNNIEFDINTSVNLMNFELVMNNLSVDNTVIVNEVSIERKNPIFNGNYEYLIDSLFTISWRSTSQIAQYVKLGDNSEQGQTLGKIFENGEIEISGVSFVPGYYSITFEGQNMDGSACSAYRMEKDQNVNLENVEVTSDRLVYEFEINTSTDDVVFCLKSNNIYSEVLNYNIKIQYLHD